MKISLISIATLATIACLSTSVLATSPDTYVGDAAIYSAIDTGGERPKPHVLLLIDTSRATLNRASGVEYSFDPDDENYVPYEGIYHPWTVYAANNQGNFNTVQVASATAELEGITCTNPVIRDTLLASGTYSGSGSSHYPNLRTGGDRGDCSTGPTGATYALGNYLNYLSSTHYDGENVIVHTYDCEIGVWRGNRHRDFEMVEGGCIGTFSPLQDHAASLAEAEPGVGLNWQEYWAQTGGGCVAGVTNCSTDSSPSEYTVDESIFSWDSGDSYTAAAFTGGTQREIIYNALTQVVEGARGAVKFAAMTYNPNNHGGAVAYDMSDLSSDLLLNNFKSSLPGMSNGELFGAELISGQTSRPQAEALYDAGYYLGARYPTGGTIASDAVFPLPNSDFRHQNIGSPMAGKYQDSNRNECGYNHIILITNGLSWGDSNPSLTYLVDSDDDGRVDESVYGHGGTHYLDDVAAFLYKQDGIVTHTVLAFQSSDPLVQRAANVGGGKYFNVYDANSLAEALTKLLAGIVLDTDTSFVAPVVPASSTNRTISSNRVYLGLFKPQNNRPWLGNLKKYGVSSDLTLLDKSGNPATDNYGDFLPDSLSYWGIDGDDKIISIDGPLPLAIGSVFGDGGNVAAGGVGGTLLVDLQAGLAAGKKAWETRKIYTWPSGSASTNLTHADNRFSPGNDKITAAILDVPTAAEKDKLVNFVAGADGYDDNNDGDVTQIRDWVLGDILHSKPLIFNYSHFTQADEGNCSVNKSMVFVGSNDGMFHAFRDCSGSEAWAFIPDNVLPNLKYLRESEHYYFMDSPPTAYVHDVNGDNIIDTTLGDKVVLIFGQGRGGGRSTLDASGSRGAYYALDVSDPEEPVLLWKIDSTITGFGELGQTWSPPRLAKVRVGNERKVVAFVGAGYDNNEDLRFGNNMKFPNETDATTDTTMPTGDSGDVSSTGSSDPFNSRGRGIYAIEVATLKQDYGSCANGNYCPDFTSSGSLVWSFVHNSDNDMDYSIPSDLTVLDMSGDTFQDRIYVGDTGGRIWRFDVGSNDTADWTSSARMIFESNKSNEANKGRKIFYRPTVAMVLGVPTLYFGTGDRSHPLNTAVTDRLFAVKDRGQTTTKNIDHLVDLTQNELQGTNTSPERIEEILDDLADPDKYGWYVDLNQNDGEKVLASALVFNKQVFFTTYAPSPSESLDDCQIGNLGTSRIYQLDYATAEAVENYDLSNDSEGTYASNTRAYGGDGIGLQRGDRVREIGVGIPSGIVTLIDASGKVTLMISSSNRVGTYGAPDARMITPLYWMQF